MTAAQPNAVILLSGGLDSATALACAQRDGFACHALSFAYGQRHDAELAAAQRIAQAMHVAEHRIAQVDLRAFGGSALTADIDVPKDRDFNAAEDDIPITYVPARNTIFLSFALGYAEVIEADDIYLGINAIDYSGYPDCRPDYLEAFERMANLATRRTVQGHRLTIHAPLLTLSKAEIIRLGHELGVDYGLTLSCYDPIPDEAAAAPRPCGHCDACLLRAQGFREAGLPDPAVAE